MRKSRFWKPRRLLVTVFTVILLAAIIMGTFFCRHLNRIPFFDGGSICFSCSPAVVEKEFGKPDAIKESEQNANIKEYAYSKITIQGIPAKATFRFNHRKLDRFSIAVQIRDENQARAFEQNANQTIRNHASPFRFLVTGNPTSPTGKEWYIHGVGYYSVYNNEWEAAHERGQDSTIPCIIIEGERK